MNRRNSSQKFDSEQESLISRIILHLHRTRRFSTIGQQKPNDKSDITIHPFPSTLDNFTHAFTNRHVHPGEMEGDYSCRPCQFHYFHLYLNLAYSLLIAPYRPRNQDGHYKLVENRFQKILCKVVCVLVVFRQFTIIRATWGRKFHHPTIFYFYLAHVHLHFVLSFIFCLTFYTAPSSLESLLQEISHCYLLSPSADRRNKGWLVVISLHILFPLMGILSPAVGHDVINSWSWTPSWLFRSYVSRARYAFFLCPDVSQIAHRPDWSEISNSDVSLTVVYILITALNELQMYMMSLMFGMCTLTLWTASCEFKKSIKLINLDSNFELNKKHVQATVTYLYYDLKGLSNSMNQAWGLFTFFYIIDIIPYLATDLDFGLRSLDWFDALKMSRSVFFFGWNMITAAETYRKTQWFLAWLLDRQNRNLFTNSMQELTLLIEELRTEPVGIGTSGFYQVTYALAAQVCTIIITFFIITLQYADLHPNAASWWT